VIASHPHVREVAVVGTPDERWGEAVTALIVTDGTSLTAEDIIAHCRVSLAGYKCPKRVEFREVLPRTSTGKLQKFLLRQDFWAGQERSIQG
jgi:acyl-CoA synthetase (AMP-forming)/AMP-acid ligase II